MEWRGAPRYRSANPKIMKRVHFSLRAVSSRSIKVCKMVIATSPLQLPTNMNPTASAAIEETSMLNVSSATRGRSISPKLWRYAPAYARPILYAPRMISSKWLITGRKTNEPYRCTCPEGNTLVFDIFSKKSNNGVGFRSDTAMQDASRE